MQIAQQQERIAKAEFHFAELRLDPMSRAVNRHNGRPVARAKPGVLQGAADERRGLTHDRFEKGMVGGVEAFDVLSLGRR